METVNIERLGVFATPEQLAVILSLREKPNELPAAINAAAEAQGLPKTEKGYGISVESREFIGPGEE